jgi:hypothetical protein
MAVYVFAAVLSVVCLFICFIVVNQPLPVTTTTQPLDDSGEWRCVSNPSSNSWVLARSKDQNNQCASKEGTTCIPFTKQSCAVAKQKREKSFWVDCVNHDFCKYNLREPDSKLYVSAGNKYPCWSAQNLDLSTQDQKDRQITSVGESSSDSFTCDFVKASVGGVNVDSTPITSTQSYNLFPLENTLDWKPREKQIHHFERQTATYVPSMTRVINDWVCSFSDGEKQFVGHYDSGKDTCVSTNSQQIFRTNDFNFLANNQPNQTLTAPKLELNIVDQTWADSIMTKDDWIKFLNDRWSEAFMVLYPNSDFPAPRRDALVVFLGDKSPYSSNVCAQCSPLNSGAAILHVYTSCFNGSQTRQLLASVISHEMAHGLQWFRSRREDHLTEGIAEYVRMSLGFYTQNEYQTMSKSQRCPDFKSYSCNGAFLHYVEGKYSPNIVRELNRSFIYESIPWNWETVDSMFVQKTGKHTTDLWDEFIQQLPENGSLYPQPWLPKARFV